MQKQGLPVSGLGRDLYASPKEAVVMLSSRLYFPQTSSSTSAFMETALQCHFKGKGDRKERHLAKHVLSTG